MSLAMPDIMRRYLHISQEKNACICTFFLTSHATPIKYRETINIYEVEIDGPLKFEWFNLHGFLLARLGVG